MVRHRLVKLGLSCCGVLAAASSLKTGLPADERPAATPTAVDPMLGLNPGQVRDDNGLKMKFVWCPPGVVTMEQMEVVFSPLGDRSMRATPVRAFCRGFWLAQLEVTQAEWRRIMKTEPWAGQESTRAGDDFPATYLDWNDAMEFCRRLTAQERDAGRLPAGWEYTLPTEAQWERACRARSETRFSYGDEESKFHEYGWFSGNSREIGETYAHPVGRKKPNAWGLYDMHGNVWEWCRDVYTVRLPGGRDPEATGDGPDRVMRGGGICRAAADCHSGYRNHHVPTWRLFDLGLRPAIVPVR